MRRTAARAGLRDGVYRPWYAGCCGCRNLPFDTRHSLFDLSGRRGIDLQAEDDDIRSVAPGAYFLHKNSRFTLKLAVTRWEAI